MHIKNEPTTIIPLRKHLSRLSHFSLQTNLNTLLGQLRGGGDGEGQTLNFFFSIFGGVRIVNAVVLRYHSKQWQVSVSSSLKRQLPPPPIPVPMVATALATLFEMTL